MIASLKLCGSSHLFLWHMNVEQSVLWTSFTAQHFKSCRKYTAVAMIAENCKWRQFSILWHDENMSICWKVTREDKQTPYTIRIKEVIDHCHVTHGLDIDDSLVALRFCHTSSMVNISFQAGSQRKYILRGICTCKCYLNPDEETGVSSVHVAATFLSYSCPQRSII